MESRCVPLSSREEVSRFVHSPAAWRALCRPLVEHAPCALQPAAGPHCHGTPRRARRKRADLPATLLCHDMAGGYHDDSFVDGTDNHEAYTFYNWAVVDIFCYFSHHFVTVPPLGWINVAHDHGVKVIGTVITEWSDGAAIWDKLLKCEREWQDFASELVAIAKCLRFEGWLLNIENKISKPKELVKFVTYLHKMLHEEIPDSVLIWYDSVTVDGHLAWQNELNDNNSVFFECTDGIFINYSWTEGHVERSAARAGYRRHRVFVGLDVWGRNFFGGGKFNTVQAAQIAHKHDCSLAIFAPAWTHEAVPGPDSAPGSYLTVPLADRLPKYDNFLLRERALWGTLRGLLNTKLPARLPFRTSFCRGQGPRRRLCGEVLSPSPWYNLRHMQYQPNATHGDHGYLVTAQSDLPELSRAQLLMNSDRVVMYRRSYDTALTGSLQFINPASESNLIETEIDPDDSDGADAEKAREDAEQTEDSKKIKKYILERMFARKRFEKVDEPVAKVTKVRDENETVLVSVPGEKECLEVYFEDAFTGGSCLKINPSDDSSDDHRTSTLLHCDFPADRDLVFCIVTKTLTENPDQNLDVLVDVADGEGEVRTVTLTGGGTRSKRGEDALRECQAGDLKQLQRYLLLEVPDFYIPIYNAFGWNVRYHVVPSRADRDRVCTVHVRCGQPRGGLLLGHFGLCHLSHTAKITEDDATDAGREQNNTL